MNRMDIHYTLKAIGGYVYLATNSDGIYKVGASTDPESRVANLHEYGPMELITAEYSINPIWVEGEVRQQFGHRRLRNKKDWYRFDNEDAVIQFIERVAIRPTMTWYEDLQGERITLSFVDGNTHFARNFAQAFLQRQQQAQGD